jgi:HTH-type transcriptional regulator/antitoxin HigA
MPDELKPIRSKADYEAAMVEFARLWDAKEGTPESDRLDVLAILIETYEAAHFSIDVPDPIDAILFRMEQQGLTRKDLQPMLGPRNRISEILNRKRSLTIDMIRALHAQLHIPAEILIRKTKETV